MNKSTHLSLIAATALFAVSAYAQSPQTPQKDPGTQPSKDGSAAQKPAPQQPGTPGGTLQPSQAPTDNGAQPGAGSTVPVPAPQSPAQKPETQK